MRTVAVMGASGGAGVTTVAASLARALHAAGHPALAFDINPDNTLRLPFGMHWDDRFGLGPALLAGGDWREAAYRSAAGADFVPFGELADDSELAALAELFRNEPGWLRRELASLDLPPETVAVCDCPRLPSPFAAQALAAADLVLVVLAPDPVSYAVAGRIVERSQRSGAPPACLLLNHFEPARPLHRDLVLLLRAMAGTALAPVTLHRDTHVSDALACKQGVLDFAPASQAAHEFATLATWTLARLGRGAEAA